MWEFKKKTLWLEIFAVSISFQEDCTSCEISHADMALTTEENKQKVT